MSSCRKREIPLIEIGDDGVDIFTNEDRADLPRLLSVQASCVVKTEPLPHDFAQQPPTTADDDARDMKTISVHACASQGCGESFMEVDDLRAHICLKHLDYFPFRCAECGWTFPTESQLKQHFTDKAHAQQVQCAMDSEKEAELTSLLGRATKVERSLRRAVFRPAEQTPRRRRYKAAPPSPQPSTGSPNPTPTPTPSTPQTDASEAVGGAICKSSYSASSGSGDATELEAADTAASAVERADESKASDAEFAAPSPDKTSSLLQQFLTPPVMLQRNAKATPRNAQNGVPANLDRKHCFGCGKTIKADYLTHIAAVHLKIRAIKCSLCNFASVWKLRDTEDHIKRSHDGKTAELIDTRDQHIDEMYRLKALYFPDSTNNRANLKRKKRDSSGAVIPNETVSTPESESKTRCELCPRAFVERRDLYQHAADVHLKLRSVECPYCTFTSGWLVIAVKKHIKDKHRDVANELHEIVDNHEQYREQVEACRMQCFPDKRTRRGPVGGAAGPRKRRAVAEPPEGRCDLCSECVKEDEREEHVYFHLHNEIGLSRFLCAWPHCERRSFARDAIETHSNKMHEESITEKVIDKTAELNEDFAIMNTRCFEQTPTAETAE